MKNYNIYKHPDGKIEAVKQGWSWPAFFFGWIWALIKQLWMVAGLLIAYAIISSIVIQLMILPSYDYYEYGGQDLSQAFLLQSISLLIQLGITIYLGVKGNSLREANLIKRGYECIGNINAVNPDSAISDALKN
ncbi:DUF2628 domain-containing protein [Frischella perrara]|uniref:DUF2628 domain-containing protein n=1 Tax=Frischella perrara TaxID=1267021 RepID=UPI0023F458CA|nr:DUF2628 domain-containing protein [Frischella perrara]MCT6875122.1 DUF2628 domain-containing protein [Frischella perrara]